MIQKVSEIEGEPLVGKFYLVPCVLDAYMDWIPILGPEHDDKEYIGLDHLHYHRDLRFLCDQEIADIFARGIRGEAPHCAPEEFAMTSIMVTKYLASAVVEKKRKCRRTMPDFPINVRGFPQLTWFPGLEAAYKDALLSSCLRCPHRGMPLKNLPKDEQGNVVCNGHGLKWNLETGKLVSRL